MTEPREAIALGIDPGLRATGFCALGDRTYALATDTRPKAQEKTHIARLCCLEDAAREWVREYRPCVVVLEEQCSMRGNAAVQEKVFAALAMGCRRGFQDAGIEEPLFLVIAPSSVKKYLTGSGNAQTWQVVDALIELYGKQHPDLAEVGEDAVMAYGMARIGLLVAGGDETLPVRELS